ELTKLAIELGRQGLVVRDHQRRATPARDRAGDRVRLARAGDAEQCLVALSALEARNQLVDRRGLIAARRVPWMGAEGAGRGGVGGEGEGEGSGGGGIREPRVGTHEPPRGATAGKPLECRTTSPRNR